MNKAETWASLIVMCFGVFLFYLVFCKLAPYLTSLLPSSEWTPLLKVVIYVLVAYFGGIAIPFVIFIFGLYLLIQSL